MISPGGKLKRSFAAAVAAVTASTSMCLAATMAASGAMARPAPPAPSATLRVVPRWTYQGSGRLAVIAGCSQRGDARVITSSKLLPRTIRMSKGRNVLIKVTRKKSYSRGVGL